MYYARFPFGGVWLEIPGSVAVEKDVRSWEPMYTKERWCSKHADLKTTEKKVRLSHHARNPAQQAVTPTSPIEFVVCFTGRCPPPPPFPSGMWLA